MWPFLVAIVAILSSMILKLSKDRAQSTAAGGRSLNEITQRLETIEADRDRLRARVEALEAIVTDEDFELEREARALLAQRGTDAPTARTSPGRLDLDLGEREPGDTTTPRQRTR
jgi:hypothetical protein